MEPEILILDEPTAGLDPVGRRSLLANIRAFQKEKNAAILMVSHSMEDMAAMADRLIVMNQGTIAFQGTPREIFEKTAELQAIGLTVPQVTLVLQRLRELGLPVDASAYTIPQAVEVLAALGKGVPDHA